jgi:hypothetical protein
MTNCKRCNGQMDEEINFCPVCGEDQRANNVNQHKSNASFLIVLCVLTIIGSVFTIGRAYLYEMVSMMDGHSNYIRGWVYAGSAVGTLAGAIMMIQKKLNGLYIYSAFQVIYIITVLVASFSYSDVFGNIDKGNAASLLASGIAMFFLLPSILFLILYWTNMIKKHLK